MEEPTDPSIASIRQKIDSLQTKISFQRSLTETISQEFESLQRDFESILHFVDSSTQNVDTTRENVAPSQQISEPLQQNFEPLRLNVAPTQHSDASTEGKSDTLPEKKRLAQRVREEVHAKLKLYYPQPNIPERMGAILAELKEKKRLSVAAMRLLTGASRASLVRDIALFKKLGWLQFHGSRNNGYFTLTADGEEAVK